MPRTLTAYERQTIAQSRVSHFLKVETKDSDGTWRDVSALAAGDFLQGGSFGAGSRDQAVTAGQVRLRRRRATTESLSPLVTTSTLNRNAAAAFAPLIDLGRELRASVAATRGVPVGTNFLLRSEFDSLSSWSAGAPTGTTLNAAAAPDAANTAMTWTGGGRLFQESAGLANGVWGASIFAKLVSGAATLTMVVKDNATDTVRGTISVVLTAAWQRIFISGTTAGATPGFRIEYTLAGATPVAALWGAMAQPGSVMGEYVRTTSAGNVSSWREIFYGRIDEVNFDDDPIVIDCSSLDAWLQDTQIEVDAVQYGGVAVQAEAVLQSLITAWPSGKLTAGQSTVLTPVSPAFIVTSYAQGRQKVLEACRSIAQQVAGWDFRFRYSATDAYVPTFMDPQRARATIDDTFGPGEYHEAPVLGLSMGDVRNAGKVFYIDASGATQSATATDAASISKYGRRYYEFTASAAIKTATQAQALIDAVNSDLSTPPLAHSISTLLHYGVQLYDRHTLLANTEQYDTNQALAVVNVQHEFPDGSATAYTTIDYAGKVTGAYADWLKIITPAKSATPVVLDVVATFPTSTTVELTLKGDANTGSWRALASTAGPPTLAAVRAAGVLVGQNLKATSTLSVAVGQRVYIAVLAYTGSAGTGVESTPMSTVELVRDGTGSPGAPSCAIDEPGVKARALATLRITGAQGTGAPATGITSQYMVDGDTTAASWTTPSSAALPRTFTVNRANWAAKTVTARVTQADGQYSEDTYPVDARFDSIDTTTGANVRAWTYDDGGTAARTTDPTGYNLDANATDSTLRAGSVRRTLAKSTYTEPDTIDAAGLEGTTYNRVLAASVAGNVVKRTAILDTRSVNTAPSGYTAMGSVEEFKDASVIGIPGATSGTYCGLRTTLSYTDGSAGAVAEQVAHFNNGVKWRRTAAPNAASWGTWFILNESQTQRTDRTTGHLDATMQDATLRASGVRSHLAKSTYTEPDTIDAVGLEGTAYNRVLATGVTSGQVDLAKAGVVGRTLTNIADAPGRFAGVQAAATGDGYQIISNPEFRGGSAALRGGGYAVYDNGSSGSVSIATVSDATAPNGSGWLLRVTHTAAGTPSPGFGGFSLALLPDSGTFGIDTYHRGVAHVWRIRAKIPVGCTLNWTANNFGTGQAFAWLTSAAGTGGWFEYVGVMTPGTTGTFQSVGFLYITGGTRPFSWDVALVSLVCPSMASGPVVRDMSDVPRNHVSNATPLSTIAANLADTGNLAATMLDSTLRASGVRAHLAKSTYTEPDTIDAAGIEGTAYNRVLATAITTGAIDFNKSGFANKNQDYIPNGSAFLRSPAVGGANNLAENGNFEASASLFGGAPPGWQSFGSPTVIAYQTGSPFSGSRSLTITGPGNNSGVRSSRVYQVTPGEFYTLSAKIRGALGGGRAMFWTWDAAFTTLYGALIVQNTTAPWVSLASGIWQAPANGVVGFLVLDGNADFDEIELRRVATADRDLVRGVSDSTALGTIVGNIQNSGHLGSAMQDSTGRSGGVRASYAKGSYTDGDTADFVVDGVPSTGRRVPLVAHLDASGVLQSAVGNTATIGGSRVARDLAHQVGRYFTETWEQTAPNHWLLNSGTASNGIISDPGAAGGTIAYFTGPQWYVYASKLPYHKSKLYRMRVRAALTNGGTGNRAWWFGVRCFDSAGAFLANAWACLSNYTPPGFGYSEFTGWFTAADASTVDSGQAQDPTAPGHLPANTAYISPQFAVNWDTSTAAQLYIDYIDIETLDEDNTERTYKALSPGSGFGKYGWQVIDSSGASGQVARRYYKGTFPHGASFTFPASFGQTPMFIVSDGLGTVLYQPDSSKWAGGAGFNAAKAQIAVRKVVGSATGGVLTGQLRQKGGTTPASIDFASGNSTSTVGGTVAAGVGSHAPSSSGHYTLRYSVAVFSQGAAGRAPITNTTVVVVNKRPGGTGTPVEVARTTYTNNDDGSGGSGNTATYQEALDIAVAMASGDTFELLLYSVVKSGGTLGNITSTLHGYVTATDGSAGIDFTWGAADCFASMTPDTGDSLTVEAFGIQ